MSIGMLVPESTLAEWLDCGDVRAQHVLGCRAYEKQDFEAAFQLWSIAAEQALPHAQFKLGWLYKQGKGVARSFAQAEKWYRLAADQGHGEALDALEQMGPSNEFTHHENVGSRAYDPASGIHDGKILSKPE